MEVNRTSNGNHINCTLAHNSSTSCVNDESTHPEDYQHMSPWLANIFVITFVCVLGPPLNVLATASNIINIVIFAKIGFAEPINISLVALAISDICGLLTLQWRSVCFILLITNANVPFDPLPFQYLTAGNPHLAFARITGFITAYMTFERCMCVVMPLRFKAIFTRRVTILVLVCIFVAILLPVIPLYTVNFLDWTFDDSRNRTWIGLIMKENRAAIEHITFSINAIYTFLAFVLVSMFTIILIEKIRNKSRWRDKATGVTAVASEDDQKAVTMSKDRRAIIMVTTISTVFIFSFLPNTGFVMTLLFMPEFDMVGPYSGMLQTVLAVSFFVEQINAGVNTIIYVKMSTKFRDVFNQMCCFNLRRDQTGGK